MLILAIFLAAGAIGYASATSLVRHEQKKLEAMSYEELMQAIDQYGAFDDRYAQERDRRWVEIAHHKNEWVN